MSTNFPGSAHTMGFVAFSRGVGNRWGNPCISQMMKYAIGWESNWKKHPFYGKSMSINFPDFPHNMDFVLLYFPVMGKSMHFPYDDIG